MCNLWPQIFTQLYFTYHGCFWHLRRPCALHQPRGWIWGLPRPWPRQLYASRCFPLGRAAEDQPQNSATHPQCLLSCLAQPVVVESEINISFIQVRCLVLLHIDSTRFNEIESSSVVGAFKLKSLAKIADFKAKCLKSCSLQHIHSSMISFLAMCMETRFPKSLSPKVKLNSAEKLVFETYKQK